MPRKKHFRIERLNPRHILECARNLAEYDLAEMALDHRSPVAVITEAALKGQDQVAVVTTDYGTVAAVGGVHIHSYATNLAVPWLWTTPLARRRPRAFMETLTAYLNVLERDGWRLLLMAPKGHPHTKRMIEGFGFKFTSEEHTGPMGMTQLHAYREGTAWAK